MNELRQQIHISVNGEPRLIKAPATVAGLLSDLSVDRRHVAVERNRLLVLKNDYDLVTLESGDHLEIVTFVGGG
jgi:sulfur carrier protein